MASAADDDVEVAMAAGGGSARVMTRARAQRPTPGITDPPPSLGCETPPPQATTEERPGPGKAPPPAGQQPASPGLRHEQSAQPFINNDLDMYDAATDTPAQAVLMSRIHSSGDWPASCCAEHVNWEGKCEGAPMSARRVILYYECGQSRSHPSRPGIDL